MTEFDTVDDRKDDAEAGDDQEDEAAFAVYPNRCERITANPFWR